MSDQRPKRDSMSIKKATISNMWEIAAIVELLEQKGLCTKQNLHTIIDELRQKNPRARIPETAFPSVTICYQDHPVQASNQMVIPPELSIPPSTVLFPPSEAPYQKREVQPGNSL
jgi:hypothetical protein